MFVHESGPELAVSHIAAEQYGLISRAQTRASGLGTARIRTRLRSGEWSAIGANVLCVGPVLDGFRGRAMAACLRVSNAVASGRTAASLWGIDGFLPREIEVVSRASNPSRPHGVIVHRTNFLPDDDVGVVHGIPVTRPARTLLDLGGMTPAAALRRAVDDALNKGLVTEEILIDQLLRAGKMGRPGTRAFRAIVEEFGPDRALTESGLENQMLEAIEAAGLPRPAIQYEIWDEGLLIARVDAAYPDQMIALEADGYPFHSARPDFVRDRDRQNALISRGWRMLRFTSDHSVRPAGFIADLRRLKGARGSSG